MYPHSGKWWKCADAVWPSNPGLSRQITFPLKLNVNVVVFVETFQISGWLQRMRNVHTFHGANWIKIELIWNRPRNNFQHLIASMQTQLSWFSWSNFVSWYNVFIGVFHQETLSTETTLKLIFPWKMRPLYNNWAVFHTHTVNIHFMNPYFGSKCG